MSTDKLLTCVAIVCILCLTSLIAQCSHRVGECRVEAVKANMKAEDIARVCHD